ncbi:MAG: nucleoside hydrolase [Dehalococcoidia bacterium]
MRLIIDTDPGVDDGVALVMALRHPGVHVEAITVVHGNAGLAHNVRNARLVTEVCGVEVPVYAGARHPIMRPAPRRPSWIHGKDGFGDIGLRPRRGRADLGFAADRIVELVMRSPGEITIVTLGPLTNIALALVREPRLPKAVRGIVLMGGAARAADNVTPVAEFNVHADPEAAKAVFRAGFSLTMAGIELSRGAARLTEEDVAAIAALATPAARLVGALLGHSLRIAARRPMLPGEHGAACPDAVGMAIALDPSIMSDHADAHVDVETSGALTTGMTVVDRLGLSGHPPNARVGYAIDAARFKALLLERCRGK